MLKYYSYYNVGGYKDMYLGNSTIAHEKTYFLPLLPHWEKKVQAGDKSLASRVEALRELPMITIVTNEASHGLPQIAKSLFSHGGYKIILANTESNELILVIRDVESTSTDDAGRKTPFLLAVVGTTEDEKRLLEKVAVYAASHLGTFSEEISSLFEYDSDKNGISFNIAALTQFLGRASCASTNSLLTRKGEIHISWKMAHVPLLVIPDGIDKKMVAKELNLQGKTVRAIDMADVIPLDDNEKLIAILKGMEINRCALWNWRVASIIGLAAALGFIAGYTITK